MCSSKAVLAAQVPCASRAANAKILASIEVQDRLAMWDASLQHEPLPIRDQLSMLAAPKEFVAFLSKRATFHAKF